MNRSAILTACLLVMGSSSGVSRVAAQSGAARDALRESVRYAQEGDTLKALALVDRAVQLDPTYAEAHFQRGLLHRGRALDKEDDIEDRMVAHDAFQAAIKWDPGNPRYLLEFGKLLLMQQIRVDAKRVLARALEVAERADAATLAEVHFQLALLQEAQWLRFRYRHVLPMEIGQLSADLALADPDFVWKMLDRSRFFEGQGEAEKSAMLRHLHNALQANPGHEGAATHLLAYYYDEGMMGAFMTEARRFLEHSPSSPRGYLAFGLGLQAQGRVDEAGGAFQYALDLLTPEERADFLSVSRIMKKEQAELFDSMAAEDAQEALRRFWTASDPLFLTPSNELWAEYLARMAYADLRFGLPEYGVPGWRTDRGLIWVRYGKPERQATFAPTTGFAGDWEAVGRVTTVWSYGRGGPVFMFRQNPGYRKATFANDFRFYAEDYRSIQASRYTAPSLPALLDLPAQIVRFRGAEGQMDLEIHAAVPLDGLGAEVGSTTATLETGLFVVDPSGAEVRRLTASETVDFEGDGRRLVRSWRTGVPSDTRYLVSVEARDPVSWAAAAHRSRVDGKTFPPGEGSVSDLLLASTLEPMVEEPSRREDFHIVAEPGLAFRADEPVGLYFELYNFLPDAEQFASYELEVVVTVEEIYREGPVSRLLGELADRWGLTEEGGRAVQLRFGKEARVLARDVIPEYFTLTLDEPPPGRYGLSVTIRDRNADRSYTESRVFEIEEGGA